MRRLLLLAPLLLAAALPEGGLPEAETRTLLKAAEGHAKLAQWALEKKLLIRARWAFDEALLLDPSREDWRKARAAIDDEAPDAENDKLQLVFQDRQRAVRQAEAKAYLELARQALEGRSFPMARKYAARLRLLEIKNEGSDEILKALEAPAAVEALKAFEGRVARAREGGDVQAAAKHVPEHLLKLPKDYNPEEDRRPVLLFLCGKADSTASLTGAYEDFRAAGFAVLALAVDSRLDKGSARDDAADALALAERMSAELGLDSRRLFLAAEGTGADAAYHLVEKSRGRFRGAALLNPELHLTVQRAAKPDPFPLLVVQEKGELAETFRKAHYSGVETGAGLLAFCQGILPPAKK